MLRVLKRITKSKSQSHVENKSSTLQTMSQNLQKKFSRGVQYNMKIIIKGDARCGKTSLFQRLQGKSLCDYSATEEIQVANVQWNYKNVEDIVKVEVWDVVDKGKKRPVLTGLKFADVTASLDAEFLDIYKGTDGVIVLFDITKPWTFNYVQRELPKVPEDIPVLILGNCCDMGHHRAVAEETVQSYVDSVQRPKGQAQVRYAESSMVNGFGLRYVYKFLTLPFLQLQRKTLRRQLDRNAEEIKIALEEIDIFGQGPHSDYSSFQNALNQRRRKNAESLGVGSEPRDRTRTPSVIFGLGHPINRYRPFAKTEIAKEKIDSIERASTQQQVSVEEFVPDGGKLDDHFFRENPPLGDDLLRSPKQSDSESEEAINPLVADFQEDIKPEDQYFAGLPSGSYFNSVGCNKVVGDSNSSSLKQDRGSLYLPRSHDSAMEVDAKKAFKVTEVVNNAARTELSKLFVSELIKKPVRLDSIVTTDSDDRKVGLEVGNGFEGVSTNIRVLDDDNREKARRKKGKSYEKRLNYSDSDPAGDSKTKKYKKVKDSSSRSKKKMNRRERLLSDSLNDLEELFAF